MDALPPHSNRTTIVVTGITGSEKASFAHLLAEAAGLAFTNGDTLPLVKACQWDTSLDGAERGDWLDAIGGILADDRAYPAGVVISAAVLKRSERDRIRASGPVTRFVHLHVEPETYRHLVASHGVGDWSDRVTDEYLRVERPQPDERNVIMIDAMLAYNRYAAREVRDLAPVIDVTPVSVHYAPRTLQVSAAG